jgi:AraC-like DNA-binding protein
MSEYLGQRYFDRWFPLYVVEAFHTIFEEHAHEFFEMVYVRGGYGTHTIEGVPYQIQAGDLYVISPSERHSYAAGEGSELNIVNVLWMPEVVADVLQADKTWSEASPSAMQGAHQLLYVEPLLRRDTRFQHRLHLSGHMAHRVETLLDEMTREQTIAGPGCQLLLRHQFCTLLVLLSRAYDQQYGDMTAPPRFAVSQRESTMSKALAYIEAHFAEPIRVPEIAAHVSLSPSRLAHIFKESTGRGIIEYLNDYRVAYACSLLQKGGLPIQEVAARAGYSDIRFFNRVFRRQTGCTPTQFRQHFPQTLT